MTATFKTRPSVRHSSNPKPVVERLDGLEKPGLVRTARRPKLIGGGVGILLMGALVGALMMGRGSQQRTVLVAATDIGVGQVITGADLQVVRVANDSPIRSLPGVASSRIVNMVAAIPILRGSTILDEQVSRVQAVPKGFKLVGVVLDAGALPSPDLRFGDHVQMLITSTTGGVDNPSKIAADATIWRVWAGQAGTSSRRVLSLSVPDEHAIEVGEAAARNNLRLLVVPTEVTGPTNWPTLQPADQTPATPDVVVGGS